MLEQLHSIIEKAKNLDVKCCDSLWKNQKIVLYGAGGVGFITSKIMKNKGYNVCCFIDDDEKKQGSCINGIKVAAHKDIGCKGEFTVLICLPEPMDSYNKLLDSGYKEISYFPLMMVENGFYDALMIEMNWEKVEKTYDLLYDDFSKKVFGNILKHRLTVDFSSFNNIIRGKQYFPVDIFTLGDMECFVDGGAYNGETISDFNEITSSKFIYIYGFAPDRDNFERLADSVNNIDNKRLKLVNSGLYSRNGEVGFNSFGNSGSYVSRTGKDKVSMTRLDDAIDEYIPTYIKLDIEGSEKEALYGMRNIICNYKPKLAVSVYHKPGDLWELPLFIHKLNTSYKLYIRHYLNGLNETVCYAI